jgi:hypothetical protein
VSENNAATFKAVLDWALKLGPVIGTTILFFFTLYSNQATMMKHDGDVDHRIAELERAANMQDRALVERLAKIDAALSELNHDLQFYQSVRLGK